MRHIHLDPLGGIAGDMFVAALLDRFPEHAAVAEQAAERLSGAACRSLSHTDGTLSGSRFAVQAGGAAGGHAGHGHRPDGHDHRHDHDHDHDHGHGHGYDHDHGHGHDGGHDRHGGHVHWAQIRARLEGSDLPEGARRAAIGIFAVLAAAEGRVHGVPADQVSFHEVGAADSVADIVAAAMLIDRLGPASWSVGSLPTGSGLIRTAHGIMPVPAPATSLLLEGFLVHDDDIGGERVTPTGAAILRWLEASPGPRPAGRLVGSGIGFGTRRLPGMSNCLRVLELDTGAIAAAPAAAHRTLAVVGFEIDDQTGEELAAGLDRLRRVPGVHDVLQMPAFGKKGRMMAHVQLLADPAALDRVVALCFEETSTIGLRCQLVEGRALVRSAAEVALAGGAVRVKLVERPGGVSGKAESDDVLEVPGHAARRRRRQDAERRAEAQAGQAPMGRAPGDDTQGDDGPDGRELG